MDFTFDEIKKLIGYKFTGVDRFYKDLKSMYKKLINLTITYERGEKVYREFTEFVLFNRYTYACIGISTIQIKNNGVRCGANMPMDMNNVRIVLL